MAKKDKKGVIMPADAKAFPGIRIGDFLYRGCTTEGIFRMIVVRVLDDDYVRTVHDDAAGELDHEEGRTDLCWGLVGDFTSLAEKLHFEALNDVDYHEPRLRYARECLAAIERGDDLARFTAGHDLD